uniref:Uncharacterized protein n=1 Tax=Arundo donax TaxID=35708 RepID=A0A0A9A5I3_ARUDO
MNKSTPRECRALEQRPQQHIREGHGATMEAANQVLPAVRCVIIFSLLHMLHFVLLHYLDLL